LKKNSSNRSNIVWVAFSLALPAAFNFLFLLFAARSQSIEEYGAIVFAITISLFITSFSDLGLRDFLLSKTALKHGLSKESHLFFNGTLFFIALTTAALLYTHFTASEPTSAKLIWLLLPEAYAFGVLQKTIFLKYQKEDQLVLFSKIDSTAKILITATKILIYIETKQVLHAFLFSSLSSIVFYAWWFLNKCWIPEEFSPLHKSFITSVAVILSKYKSWIFYTLSFFSFYLYTTADKLIIAGTLGEAKLALYMAAFSLVSLGQIFVSAAWSLYMPKISRDQESVSKKSLFFQATISGLIFSLIYYFLGPPAIQLLFPLSYFDSIQTISILSLFFLFRFPNVVFEIYWVAQERYSLFVKLRLIAATISIAANFLLIPTLGFQVAAWTMVFSELLLLLLIVSFQLKSTTE